MTAKSVKNVVVPEVVVESGEAKKVAYTCDSLASYAMNPAAPMATSLPLICKELTKLAKQVETALFGSDGIGDTYWVNTRIRRREREDVFVTPKGKRWNDSDGNEYAYEVDIMTDAIGKNPRDLCVTIAHALIHLYANIHDIKVVPDGSSRHNKEFKSLCDKFGVFADNAGRKEGIVTDYAIERSPKLVKALDSYLKTSSKNLGMLAYVCQGEALDESKAKAKKTEKFVYKSTDGMLVTDFDLGASVVIEGANGKSVKLELVKAKSDK